MPETAQATDQFSQVLDALTEFKDYFTNDDKITQWVDYLHAETGIPKADIRLAIKRIAPFLATTVGVPMLNKLHGKLSEYHWYLTLSQRLLDSLKTMSDKSLDRALEIPANKHLEALVTDKAKWANLKPEHQGLIQLLLGQNALSEGLDSLHQDMEAILRQQLDTFVGKFSIDLDLKTPDFLITEAQDAKAGSAQWLTYARRQADLIGRDNSQQQLNKFFEQEEPFSWWVISGSGGVGKSRLALDAIERRQNLWDVGFLPHAKLKKADALNAWQPRSPTIVVIDYAAEYPEAISEWIDHFIQHRSHFDFPLRLLILEREYKNQHWWEQLISGSSDALIRKNYLFTQSPHELKPLTKTEQRTALASFLASLQSDQTLPEDDSEFWQSLNELSDQGRPLFIGMVAVAIAEHGIHNLREWNQQALLDYVLEHEKVAWHRQFPKYSTEQQAKIYQLFVFTTVTSGLIFDNTEQLYKTLRQCEFATDDSELEANIAAVNQLSGGTGSYALQPDIFGEYFVLQQWAYRPDVPNALLHRRLLAAHKYNAKSTYAFLTRAAIDFPKDKTPFHWLSALRDSVKKKKQADVDAVAFGIIDQLSLHGNYTEALHWLSTLCASEEQKTKARALNLYGIQNYHLGNHSLALDFYEQSLAIQQEIGDKSGEGSTLNNIATTYHARGDYATALHYLQQSLAITQEIGDKSGEGTTLNNISQIYGARGDYEIALHYLQQSLAITQEIGDKSGEGITLNNISQIYDDRGDYATALHYLQQSLAIRQEIGDKSGEGTTLNNISHIYYTRGDYEIALHYLKQSLAIKQEIGDIAGMCATKFNIGHIQRQNDQHNEAFKSWAEAYATSSQIGLAQVLAALEKMAEDLSLPGGLEYWAALADKLNQNSDDTPNQPLDV
ncbi:MAG: hypothetical protein CSA79_02155 [Thiothrix nivea]|nr:MAG: hypothetical protein CSA79_02155 [Thiothrix nivea]